MKKLLLFLLCCLFTVSCSDVKIDINQKYPSSEESVFTIDGEGNYIVEAVGGEVVVKVTTNLEYDVILPEGASWLTLAETRTVREEVLTFSIAENDNLEARTAVVALVCADGKELQSITINQNGADPVFTIDGEGNYIVEAVGGDISVKVTTNLEYEVVIPEEVEWLTLTDTRAVREETLRFTISENEELEERSAMVVLRGLDGEVLQSITIKQKGADPLFESDAESEYTVEAKGGEVLVKVTTNLQYDVVIAEDASWVAVGDTRAVREETLRFTASENEELEERSAVVELKGVDGEVLQSFTIKQKGADPLFTTDGEGNYLVEAEGGNIAVNITTNLEYDVVIEEDVSWVSVLDTRAVREETLTVAVAKNEEFEERSATLLLVDSNNNTLQEITITQESDAANVPDNQIWYLATSQIAPNAEAVFGANIISHDFADGKGVITFDGAVTSITNSAFAKCADVTMIALPQSVERIEEGCFSECANLEMLISSFATLDNRALVVDGVMVAFAPKGLTSYTTPATARRIGEYTFAYCMELVNVTIDYDTEVIGAWSFTHCEELVNAHIADSVTTIEAGAFSYCYKLGMSGAYTIECGCIMRGGTVVGLVEGIDASGTGGGYLLSIPSYTTSIATGTFMGNDDINEVVIPASVTEISAWAFTGCHNLVRVICEPLVPPTAVFVDGVWDSFDDQHADRKICVPYESVKAYREAEGWSEYADDIVGFNFETGEIIPDVETNIIYYTSLDGQIIEPYNTDEEVFGANIISNIYEDGQGIITFDNTVTSIGWYAFSNCENLTSITIPDSVTEIGYSAFYNCSSLASITIPDSVTTIGDWTFASCDSLTSVTIGNSVTSIGEKAFEWCTSLTSVTIPDSVTEIGYKAFYNCESLTSVTISDSVTSIGEEAFAECTSLTNIYGKFASVDNRCLIVNGKLIAFAIGCGATEYTIPDSVTEIGYMAFAGCDSLTSITIPDSVTEIGNGAFYLCTSLKSVLIPDSVTSIGDSAFSRCSALTSVTIPDGVTEIRYRAFYNCKSLISVYCKPTTPPTGDYQMFNNNASGRKIYVPAESVDAYKSAEGWSNYADAIVGYDFETGEVVEKADVYLYADHAEVYTAEGLLQWAYIVNNGAISAFEGIGGYDAATFDKNAYGLKVMANIKMPAKTIVADAAKETYVFTNEAIEVIDGVATGSNWNPVCSQVSVLEDAYSGWVEGQNKTISGLRINTNANYVAFIGFMFDGVFVKNLTFNDAYVNGADNVGVVAGRAQNDTLIENVHIQNSTITGASNVGTLTGYNYSRVGGAQGQCYSEGPAIVRNCSNDANTKVVATGDNVGGIVGTNYAGTIYNCQNYADVIGRSGVGGIAGYTRDYYNNKDGYIIACTSYSDATITATKEKGYIGGIAGSTHADNLHTNTYTHIVACASFSEVVGGAESKKGAIIGKITQDQHTVGCVAIKNGVTDLYGSGKPTTDSGIMDAILYDAAYGATQSDVDALNAAITHYNGKNPPSEAYCNFTWALVNSFPVLR